MFQTFLHSVIAFLRGKLFQDTGQFVGRGLIGVALVLVAVFALNTVLPLWLAVSVAGLLGGIVQPRLFRDLKYR
jgi:hypothetical protein